LVAAAGSALYSFHLARAWRLVYIVTATGRERGVMRPFALVISPLLAGDRLTTISLGASALSSAAPFSMAVASSGASTVPSRTAWAAIL
jgi:hypothetical protein